MAVCEWCQREMTTAASCSVAVLHRDGEAIGMIPWGNERGWAARKRCGDCGVVRGGLHHLGCDVQRCPLCFGQMMSCDCRFDEDGPDQEDDEDEVDADIPESDITTVDGIPVTTPLRTVIDLAPEVDRNQLERMVEDCLERRLSTVAEAWTRVDQPDMLNRPGALLLREVLPDM